MPSLQPCSLRGRPSHGSPCTGPPGPLGRIQGSQETPSFSLPQGYAVVGSLWPGQPGPAASCLLFLLHHDHYGGERLPEMLQAALLRLQGHTGDTQRTLGSPLETSKGCWGPLRSPTAPRGQDASLSLASWGCGQDERRRSLIFTSSEVAVRSQALPWSLGGSQRRGGFWRLRIPAGPQQLVCEGPTVRLPSPAPPSVSAPPPFPTARNHLPSCPPGPGNPPPTTLLVLLQCPQLPQRAPSLSCWAGLLSGPPVPSATACSAQDPCSSRRARAQPPP